MTHLKLIVSVLAFFARSADCFLTPQTLVTRSRSSSLFASPPTLHFDTVATQFHSSISLAAGDSLASGIQTFFLAIGGIVAAFLLLSVVVATFLVPAAARELETNVRNQYPDLWREYEAKLEPGEDLTMRPD